jgi:hypothetical protein
MPVGLGAKRVRMDMEEVTGGWRIAGKPEMANDEAGALSQYATMKVTRLRGGF